VKPSIFNMAPIQAAEGVTGLEQLEAETATRINFPRKTAKGGTVASLAVEDCTLSGKRIVLKVVGRDTREVQAKIKSITAATAGFGQRPVSDRNVAGAGDCAKKGAFANLVLSPADFSHHVPNARPVTQREVRSYSMDVIAALETAGELTRGDLTRAQALIFTHG